MKENRNYAESEPVYIRIHITHVNNTCNWGLKTVDKTTHLILTAIEVANERTEK